MTGAATAGLLAALIAVASIQRHGTMALIAWRRWRRGANGISALTFTVHLLLIVAWALLGAAMGYAAVRGVGIPAAIGRPGLVLIGAGNFILWGERMRGRA